LGKDSTKGGGWIGKGIPFDVLTHTFLSGFATLYPTYKAQAEKNRLHVLETVGPSTAGVQKEIKKHIKFLEAQIADLGKGLKKLIREHPDIDENVRLLCSIPGVGETTASAMLSEIGDVSRFDITSSNWWLTPVSHLLSVRAEPPCMARS